MNNSMGFHESSKSQYVATSIRAVCILHLIFRFIGNTVQSHVLVSFGGELRLEIQLQNEDYATGAFSLGYYVSHFDTSKQCNYY